MPTNMRRRAPPSTASSSPRRSRRAASPRWMYRTPRVRRAYGWCSPIGPQLTAGRGPIASGLPTADRHDPVEPLIAGLVGSELKSELAAHHSGEEPSDRVRLPARHRHDGLKGRALGALKHGDDPRLLGASAGTGSWTSGGCLYSGPPVPANPAAALFRPRSTNLLLQNAGLRAPLRQDRDQAVSSRLSVRPRLSGEAVALRNGHPAAKRQTESSIGSR